MRLWSRLPQDLLFEPPLPPPPPPSPGVPPPVPPVVPEPSSSSDSSEFSLVEPHRPPPLVPFCDQDDYQFLCDGARLDYEDRAATTSRYVRLRIHCRHHHLRTTTQNIGPLTCKRFGKFEPLGFLAIWHQRGLDPRFNSVENHKKARETITAEEVEAWLRRSAFPILAPPG